MARIVVRRITYPHLLTITTSVSTISRLLANVAQAMTPTLLMELRTQETLHADSSVQRAPRWSRVTLSHRRDE
jgi:hypothetical protein